MQITLFVQLGDDENPLRVATFIEDSIREVLRTRRVLIGDGTDNYKSDSREVKIILFEA